MRPNVWTSTRYQGLPERSRERFDIIAQRALASAKAAQPPERRGDTIARLFDLLEAVSRRGAYLALLTEYPAALERVLAVLGASRWAAGYLIRHPQLLDELLDDEVISSPFDWTEFRASLRKQMNAADGAEQQMDLLRHAHQAEVFRILLIDLSGKLTVEHVSDRLSELADAVLDVTIETVWSQFPKRHREVPRFSVIAYGKLGGKELGYASDLDLIFLHDDPDDAAVDIYAMFARRLVTWLTTATGAGTLFDVDLRLRPNGESGLLVTSLESFRRYQIREGDAANTAWVWEHQALSRARFCAGDAEIGARFEEIRAAGLYDAIWQAFAVLLPVRTVGVMGDGRTYDFVCALRAVTSVDGMTADFFPFDMAVLGRSATRIINEVKGINRVVYDVTSKPPGTIEWE